MQLGNKPMTSISAVDIGLFAFLLSSQILAVSLLPRTAGFTDPMWTAACLGTYFVSLWCLSYMMHKGMQLSLLVPILAAAVPLASIAVGAVFYKEDASAAKIAALCAACGLIGVASMLR